MLLHQIEMFEAILRMLRSRNPLWSRVWLQMLLKSECLRAWDQWIKNWDIEEKSKGIWMQDNQIEWKPKSWWYDLNWKWIINTKVRHKQVCDIGSHKCFQKAQERLYLQEIRLQERLLWMLLLRCPMLSSLPMLRLPKLRRRSLNLTNHKNTIQN